MSATNRGSERVKQDVYITPDYTINSLLEYIDFSKAKSFCEPCRGTGAIYNKIPLEEKFFFEISEGFDYLSVKQEVDLIITNPPFSLAEKFLEKSLSEAKTVIYLERINWLGSQCRHLWWQNKIPTHLLVLSKRPKFIKNGSDACEYAWFCWDKLGVVKLPSGISVI